MEQRRNEQSTLVIGGLLIATGLFFLVAQTFELDLRRLYWPYFVIVPGAFLLVLGILAGPAPARGFVIPGVMVVTVGCLLLYQSLTGHWESWAYAWALVAPTSVGVGIALMGLLSGRPQEIRGGLTTALVGLCLFAGFAAFFEGILHISGRDFGMLGTIGFPLVLIGLGVWSLVARLTPSSASTRT